MAGTTIGQYNTALPVLDGGDRGEAQLDVNGNLRTRLVAEGASVLDGVLGQVVHVTQRSNVGTSVPMSVIPYSFNGTTSDPERSGSVARLASSAATTNATVGKASAGKVLSIVAYNSNAAVRYLKIYNKATAPVVGTDTPIMTIPLKPADRMTIDFSKGVYCSAGISFALTTGAADADATAVGAGDITGLNLVYN